MLESDSVSRGGPIRPRVGVAAFAIVVALSLAACGGDDQPSAEPREAGESGAATATTPTETTAQPPPESSSAQASGGAEDSEASNRSEEMLAEDAVTGPQSCPDVAVTPNSGDGLFDVEAEGMTCEDASAALQAWGGSGYQGAGPPGFSCEEVSASDDGSTRLSCEQEASGGVVEFNTGS